MKSYYFLLSLVFCNLFFSQNVLAQKDDVLFTFGNHEVKKSEFMRGYEKNAIAKKPSYTLQDLNEYLDLYVNYKLKVQDAADERLDTISSIQKEYNEYKKQLTQSFLTDKNISDALIKETYDRLKTEVKASHLLVKLPENPSPADTIAAWNKIMELRKKIKSGEKFETVAEQFSDDPSAKINKGSLGYFTALQMVYPFETAAYTTSRGDVSNPVRTKFGYHLVKVDDTRPARGELQVAHILLKIPENATPEVIAKVKAKADSIYTLSHKMGFEELVRLYSEDRNSTSNEGKLPWFTTGKMVEEFEDAAFALKNKNDISTPIKTKYGYHIIKLIDHKGLQSYDDMKEALKKKIEKDSRSEISKQAYLNKIKKENNFVDYPEAYDQVLSRLGTDFNRPTWKPDAVLSGYTSPLFKIAGKNYTQDELVKYILANKNKIKPTESKRMLAGYYDAFLQLSILEVEEGQLLAKNPEFAAQLQEYKDGILLFDLMEKKVWNAAVHDTTGLKAFYESNKAKYQRPESVKVMTIKCANANVADQVAVKLKKFDEVTSKPELIAAFNTKDHPKDIIIDENYFEKNQNNKVDEMKWQKGEMLKVTNASGTVDLYYVIDNVTGQYKTLSDSKGYIVADYQEYLEKNWIEQLKAKYPVKVNQTVVNSLVKK